MCRYASSNLLLADYLNTAYDNSTPATPHYHLVTKFTTDFAPLLPNSTSCNGVLAFFCA